MCGRFTSLESLEKLASLYQAEIPRPWEWEPNYNAAPTQILPVVIEEDGARIIEGMRWGLVPFWAKDIKIGNSMINARAETVDTKPGFRDSFMKKRCIIPANGFYEWQKLSTVKRPFYFTPKEGLFSFAGLWSHWDSPEGKRIETFTIITTAANDVVKPIHDRMPVSLGHNSFAAWMAEDTKKKDLQDLLTPFTAGAMQVQEVSRYVNSPKNTGPQCIVANSA